jgi:hypothetical protein
LIIEGSQIEDGEKAIVLEDHTAFTTTTTTYHNNHVAISAELDAPGEIDFQVLGGNTFTADDLLSREPFDGQKARAAIWLTNVNEAVIEGQPPHIDPGLNTIGNLTNGIVLYNTDASIHNFHIYDIKTPTPKIWLGDHQPDGHAIYVNGTSGGGSIAIGSETTRDNYINGSHNGIFVKGTSADIRYCNIHNGISAITLGYAPKSKSVIANSLIDAQYRGIQLLMPGSLEVDIMDNRLTMHGISAVGIQGLTSWGEVNIHDNRFFLYNNRSGITLTDCRNVDIRDNHLIFEENSARPMKGISLEYSERCKVIRNTTLGKNWTHPTVAIHLQDSPNNTVMCNTSAHVNAGAQFTGMSSFSLYAQNWHNRSGYGLLLGSDATGSDAVIGRQSHKMNLWPPSVSYGIAGAEHLSDDPAIITRSQFIVDNNQTSFYPPNLTALINKRWFATQTTDEYHYDCENINEPVEPHEPSDGLDLINGDTLIGFDTYPDIKNHLLRRQFYTWLLENPADTGASQYMVSAMADTLGQRGALLASALTESDAVTDAQTYLTYEMEANNLLARYLADGDVEELVAAFDTLKERAQLCAYEYGPAVYLNRAMIQAIDLDAEFFDETFCGTSAPRPGAGYTSVTSARVAPAIRVYPNPSSAGSNVHIESAVPIEHIDVFDISGRLALSVQPAANDALLTRFQLKKEGLYFVRVKSSDGYYSVLKAIIMK